jgi:hypothetical protein
MAWIPAKSVKFVKVNAKNPRNDSSVSTSIEKAVLNAGGRFSKIFFVASASPEKTG